MLKKLYHAALLICLLAQHGWCNTIKYKKTDKYRTTNDMSILSYLLESTKLKGVGFNIAVKNTDQYTNLHVTNDNVVRVTTADYTFYFYRDGNKYYIRDASCKFLCANPCGVVFTSSIRLQHYCRFNIKMITTGLFKIYLDSRNNDVVKYKSLDFVVADNKLRALTNLHNYDDVKASFRIHGTPIYDASCPRLSTVDSKNLDALSSEDMSKKCAIPDQNDNSVLVNYDVHIKQDRRQYYQIKIGEEYIDGEGGVVESSKVFQKHFIKPNVYAFRNINTCKFICQNANCGVYMSSVYSNDCKLRVEQSLLRDSFFVKFIQNNYYLSYTNKNVTYSSNPRSKIEFDEYMYGVMSGCPSFDIYSPSPVNDINCHRNKGTRLFISAVTVLLSFILNKKIVCYMVFLLYITFNTSLFW
ncbi:fibroblast growth factor 2 [Epinotia aporema granulovirus]|uniref:Fibroblast growth factor 2 n=1 Tax=Epinotia aporema granulovirus TaxID=166056 RepID=K4ER73_9BBAC|nr:fibroblast growth factor 2 [Epinotia aporema granulovirus]AER41544.1 fibroblast growth factor 2 [Epinotia aporema granulovirus]